MKRPYRTNCCWTCFDLGFFQQSSCLECSFCFLEALRGVQHQGTRFEQIKQVKLKCTLTYHSKTRIEENDILPTYVFLEKN